MRKSLILLLAGLLSAPATSLLAAQVPGLYEATVPVADQKPESREHALRQALHAVLVRVTGSRTAPSDPAAQGIIARANAMVLGYGYENVPDGAGLQFRARFDARALESALRSYGLPVWGANRPSHLVWIALRDDGHARAVLDATAAATRAAGLLNVAQARGIVLTFPSMDATDRRLVGFDELWDGRYEDLIGASRRYPADQILAVRAGRDGGRWTTRWALMDNGVVVEEWISVRGSLDEALAEGLNELADREGQRFAVRAIGDAENLLIRVSGVSSLRDYSRVLNYLRGLNPVKSGQIERVEGDTVTYRLEIEGNPDTLLRVIASGRMIRRSEDAESLFNPVLHYVLVR